MKKLYMLLAASILQIGMDANAAIITTDEAREIANDFFASSVIRKVVSNDESHKVQLAYIGRSSERTDYYVFNRNSNDGFVIIAADSQLSPIIGYSDHGSYHVDALPDNVRWWLGQYGQEIDYIQSHGTMASKANASYLPVAPMLESTWGQGEPYSGLTPMVTVYVQDGIWITPQSVHSAAGDVAVSLGQIMKYYQWPTQGKGSTSYSFLLDNNIFTGMTISADYSNSVYDWSKMAMHYDTLTSTTAEQDSAIAKLIFDVGTAAHTTYAGKSSHASTINAMNALLNHFSYSPTVRYVRRDVTPIEEWKQMLRDEIDAGRPVLYSGSGHPGNHAFVVDGYDENGLFHINWGWNGECNGYFAITLLNANDDGVNTFEDGFNSNQEAVIGIAKDDGQVGTVKRVEGYYSNMAFSDTDLPADSSTTVYIYNYLLTGVGYQLQSDHVRIYNGFEVQDNYGNPVVTIWNDLTGIGIELNTVYTLRMGFSPKSLADGKYRLVPVYMVDNDEKRFYPKPLGTLGYYEMTIANRIAHISAPKPEFDVQPNSIKIDDTERIYAGREVVCNMQLLNRKDSEFVGDLRLEWLSDNDSIIGTAIQYEAHIQPEAVSNFNPVIKAPNEGRYYVRLYVNDVLVGQSQLVNVFEGDVFQLRIVSQIEPEYPQMLPDSVCAYATLTNAYTCSYGDRLEALVAKAKVNPDDNSEENVIVGRVYSDMRRIVKDDTVQVYFHGKVPGLVLGETYRLMIRDPKGHSDNDVIGRECTFVCGLHKSAPKQITISNIDKSSFTASWPEVINTKGYEARIVASLEDEPILKETFANCTNDGRDITSSLASYTDLSGWTGKDIFEAQGGIRLGKTTSNATYAYAYAPNVDLRNDNNRIVVHFKAAAYGTAKGCWLYVSNSETGYSDTVTICDNTMRDYEVEIVTNKKKAQRIGFRTAGANHLIVLSDVSFYFGHPDYVVATQNCETSTCLVDNLEPDKSYRFMAKSIYDDGSRGGWSEVANIMLQQALTGDVNGDGLVDVVDVNHVINYILNSDVYSKEADLNGDGTIDVNDVNQIINIILGRS